MKLLILNVLHKLYVELYCLILFLRNYVTSQKLIVEKVQIYERVLILGNTVTLDWNLKGCHRITMSNIGSFPGTSRSIVFVLNSNKPVEICFYGVDSKLRRQIKVNTFKINLTNSKAKLNRSFEIKSLFASKIETQLRVNNLKSVFRNPNPQTAITKISLNFDAFNEINQLDN